LPLQKSLIFDRIPTAGGFVGGRFNFMSLSEGFGLTVDFKLNSVLNTGK